MLSKLINAGLSSRIFWNAATRTWRDQVPGTLAKQVADGSAYSRFDSPTYLRRGLRIDVRDRGTGQ